VSLPVILSQKSPLPRGGLVAGWDLRNTGDVQSVPNLVPGGAALQRGSTAGADTNDPTPSAAGWVFATDDYGTGGPMPTGPRTIIAVGQTNTALFANIMVSGETGTNIRSYIGTTEGAAFWGWGSASSGSTALTQTGTVWKSLAMTGAGSLTTFYENGSRLGTLSGGSETTSGNVQVGRGGSTSYLHFNGTIAYVLIYNRALNPAEIKRLHERFLKPRMAAVGVTLP
jgi:hypothetical protein